ncbi:MAG: hypothetical protein P1P63_05760 [Treponemataceae bacterium]
MKKIAAIFFMAVFCFTAGFAQQSMTSISTQGQFGNDVDNFMDVNSWQQVNPEKAFLYGGFGESGNGSLELGFAKQFPALYFGTYMSGGLPTWTINKSTSKKNTTVTNSLTSQFLFGFGNMGIKTGIYFYPYNISHTKDSDAKTENWNNNYTLGAELDFGINLGDSQIYAVNAGLSVSNEIDIKKTKTDGKLSVWDNKSEHALSLRGGVETDYANSDGITKTWGLSVASTIGIFPSKKSYENTTEKYTYQKGRSDFNIFISPKWALQYETTDSKFGVKFTTSASTGIQATKEYDYDKFDSKKSYNTSRKTDVTYSVRPDFNLGLYFIPTSEKNDGKVKLNAGVGLTCPSMTVVTHKTEDRNPDTGKVEKTTKNTKTTLDGSMDGSVSFGLSWFITDAVTFDASCDIFNKFTTSIATIRDATIAFSVSAKF